MEDGKAPCSGRLATVAVPVPSIGALTYQVPDNLPIPVPGARVLVPLGTRILTGVVIATDVPPAADTDAAAPEFKDVIDVLDT